MECNCIKEIEERLLAHYPTYNNKTVRKVTANGSYRIPDFKKVTMTEFNLEIENQKKEHPISIAHSFCPFCGNKHETESNKTTP